MKERTLPSVARPLRRALRQITAAVGGQSLRLGSVTIHTPLPVCLLWFWLLYWDASGFAWIGLLTSLWHEMGHLLCYRLLQQRWPALTVSLGGIGLTVPEETLEPLQQFALAAAGPLTNLLTAAVLAGLLRHRATVRLAAYWAANCLIGGFNLLPIPPLDGYQLVRCGWKIWANKLHFRRK